MDRNMIGYGNNIPLFLWPNKATIAINFVVNYEEGAELTPLNGDKYCERYGGEFSLSEKSEGERSLSMESLFEYGSRAGIWLLMRLFDEKKIPITCFATGYALTLNSEFCNYLKHSNHEVAGHGWRWIDYAEISREEEERHIKLCVKTIKALTNKHCYGWYTGRRSLNTRDLLLKMENVIYDSESYADDLPYYDNNHLIIPYTLDCNDFRFVTTPGFNTPLDFYHYLQNTFDFLYQENRLAMMTIGLHARISGHPGRCFAVKQFIDYIKQFSNVWITRRIDIANYWNGKFQNQSHELQTPVK